MICFITKQVYYHLLLIKYNQLKNYIILSQYSENMKKQNHQTNSLNIL